MNVCVAIHTLTSSDESRVGGGSAARNRRVRRGIVALLAQARFGHLQQLFVRGPVWVVTVAAVLYDRRMLPEERPAFFRVAGETDLIYRRPY